MAGKDISVMHNYGSGSIIGIFVRRASTPWTQLMAFIINETLNFYMLYYLCNNVHIGFYENIKIEYGYYLLRKR